MPDFMPHHRGLVGRIGAIGKRISPALARVLTRPSAATAVRYASIYLDVVQGKGSGAGWDMRGELKAARAFIHDEHPVIFDVGAHRGVWTQAMLDAFGQRCHVYQFEPLEYNVRHLAKKQRENVTLIAKAVSDSIGTATLYGTAKASSTSSMYERRESIFEEQTYDATVVGVTTIDATMAELGLDVVHFVKMDIEGHELAALRGALGALRGHRIRALTFEFGSGNINSRTFFHDFWDLLTPLGYAIWRICPGGALLPVRRYYEDLE